MSEPIKVGDLVQVIHCCCVGTEVAVGHIFVVSRIVIPKGGRFTHKCGFFSTENKAIAEHKNRTLDHAPLSWLKRIPPLSELEGEQRKEEINA